LAPRFHFGIAGLPRSQASSNDRTLRFAQVQRNVSSLRIPFDSFVLSAVVAELQAFVSGKIQEVRQPNDNDIVLGLYASGREAMLVLSCDPIFSRAYLVTKRPGTMTPPPAFCATLRARIEGARIADIQQIENDRILQLILETPNGAFRLIAELMGKHSNLILVEPGGRVLSAAKWVGQTKSSRPIQSGSPYEWPPVLQPGSVVRSPFYRKLAEALGGEPKADSPVLSVGHGAYPASVAALGLPELKRPSISIALEQHFALEIPKHLADGLRSGLVTQLQRVVLARETALHDLGLAEEAGGKAPLWQRYGELILAYGPAAEPGRAAMKAWDYDGAEVEIKIDPDQDYKANAAKYFDKAKRAKGRMSMVRDQIARLSEDLQGVLGLIARVESAERLDALKDLQEEARKRRWLTLKVVQAKAKEDRPYEGHRIRELTGPGGWPILYGENAESNDYLTLRVAKPSDLWLHIRGSTSAHVVIVTRNQPERVQRETLEFAAKVAVQNSPSKHAGYVPVDYTLKRYVRKPRGAAKGAAVYTNEKTIHVDLSK